MSVLATSLLNVIFVIIGGYVTISYLFPMLRDFLTGAISDEKVLDGLMGVINLYVIVFVLYGIVDQLLLIGNQYVNYVSILIPGLDLILGIVPYLNYLIGLTLVIIAFKSFKSKK